MARVKRPKAAACANPNVPISDSRWASGILPSVMNWLTSRAHAFALSGASDSESAMWPDGEEKLAACPKKALCVPVADLAVFSVNPKSLNISVKSAIVCADSAACVTNPKSSK